MILYIGQYRGGSDGWSEAAKNYLKALQATGLDVSSRPIFMNNCKTPDGQVWDTEKPVTEKPKIVIQNVLPDYFEYMPGYNIGIIFTETKRLNYNQWIYKINLLDELWVNTESEKKELKKSGVNIKISVIPMPIDTDYLEGNLDNIDKMAIPQLKDKYVFYFVGDHSDRKNLDDLVRAFNLEFTIYDNVILLIKTTVAGIAEPQAQEHMNNRIKELKQQLRIHNNPKIYPREIIITQHLPYEQILALHKTCDCFVSASRGESIAIPALYATYMDNPVICPQGIYTADLLKESCTTVPSKEVPVFTDKPPLPHLYTSNERWSQIDIIGLGKAMRKTYDSWFNPEDLIGDPHILYSNTSRGQKHIIDNFSYQTVADKIKENLSWAL